MFKPGCVQAMDGYRNVPLFLGLLLFFAFELYHRLFHYQPSSDSKLL